MTLLVDHPYAEFLEQVTKPTRYTGAEHGSVRKDWASVEARVCLAFPDLYDIGMSHLGYRILYSILNGDPRTLAERCYMPWLDLLAKLREHDRPLVSLESGAPLNEFDVVGFSLQYELTYTNVLAMLELGRIPLRSAGRGEEHPLVLAGGPVATHMEPIAPFIDAALIGDGEEAATEIALEWVRSRERGLRRGERLERLARIPGVYVPSLYDTTPDLETGLEVATASRERAPFRVQRRVIPELDRFPFPDDGPVGGPEAVFDRMSIEIARGCTEGCRFCQAGMIYRPLRERSPERVISTVLSALAKSGQDEVGLTALSTADVSSISPLIQRLAEKTAPERVSLGVASLRAYGLSEQLLDDMRTVRASGLTFAPEAATQRLRDVINKNVTEAQLLETAERVFARGFDKMKLYFMIGLPSEQDEDVRSIIELGKNTLAVGKRVGARPTVTVSVSTHVPKPHTPFQWCAMDSLERVREKQELLRSAARGIRGLSLRTHDAETSVLECILARGDRRLADVIERVYRAGACFDSWEGQLNLERWREAFEHFQIDPGLYLAALPLSARLPWDHIDIGLEGDFLRREHGRALAARVSPPCGKPKGQQVHHTNVADALADSRRLVCYDCGAACDLTAMRERRLAALQGMNALVPGERARLPSPKVDAASASAEPDNTVAEAPGMRQHGGAPLAQSAPARPRRAPPEKYRPPRAGTPTRWRLKYGKLGALALLGHLDLIRELPRVVRRAGVATAYTEGFHPKAHMSFAPALSLGAASLGEYVDIKLIDAPAPEVLLERLNQAAPPGMPFFGAAVLGPNDAGLNVVIDSADYVLALPEHAVGDLGGPAELEARLRALLARDAHVVRRQLKGQVRDVDVRRHTLSLTIGAAADVASIRAAGLSGPVLALGLKLAVSQTGGARPAEVLEALVGHCGFPHQLVRVELRAGAAGLLEVDAIRDARLAAAAVRRAPGESPLIEPT